MTEYHTQSGSIYEVDEVSKRVRVIAKANPAQRHRLGAGEWKEYESLNFGGEAGDVLWFWWKQAIDEFSSQEAIDAHARGEPVRTATHTSPVVAIVE